MRICDSNGNRIGSLSQALDIKEGSIVQVAGSGGKTTLISRLAYENKGKKVAILTTTKRYKPKNHCIILEEDEKLSLVHHKGSFLEIGTIAQNGKVGWIGDENYKAVKAWADVILIEADGSKHMPLKATSDHDPVFVPDATHTLVVCGLSSLGKPISEVCHRFDIIADVFKDNAPVTKDIIAYLFKRFYLTPYGGFNPYIILNQADTHDIVKIGTEILNENGFKGFISSLLDK